MTHGWPYYLNKPLNCCNNGCLSAAECRTQCEYELLTRNNCVMVISESKVFEWWCLFNAVPLLVLADSSFAMSFVTHSISKRMRSISALRADFRAWMSKSTLNSAGDISAVEEHRNVERSISVCLLFPMWTSLPLFFFCRNQLSPTSFDSFAAFIIRIYLQS